MNVRAARFVGETVPTCRVDASHLRRLSSPRASLATLVVVFVGATLPLHARDATARATPRPRQRANPHDVLHSLDLLAAHSDDPTGSDGSDAIDGREDTAWTGRAGEARWRLTFLLTRPVHVGLLRAHWGETPTSGVPTVFRWEVRRSEGEGVTCQPPPANDDASWKPLEGAEQSSSLWNVPLAQPTRRSWFVDTYACGLRLVVDRTNAALPIVREVQAIESASNVLAFGRASDDGAYPGFHADAVVDGAYGTRWAGAPGKSRWTLRVDLPEPQTIDRVRLIFGFDSTGTPRPTGGLSYAMQWAPIRYALEGSEDGEHFAWIANAPTRADGNALPVRRRLITLSQPRRIRALRLIVMGATGSSGLAESDAVPVVRELAAYRADDGRPILAAPWILSVNANPSMQSYRTHGGEVANDAYHAKFLQARFSALLPAMRADDRFARSISALGQWTGAAPTDETGEAIESIEGDDPELDAQFLARSSPPPIVVFSGSNDWDYAADTGPDPACPTRWRWDPLRDAHSGGMGQVADAVQNRVAPFLGFCGGAQILALLEARRSGSFPEQDLHTIDRVLQRTSANPIRGFAPSTDVDRAWPTDPQPRRAEVDFLADNPLFFDLAGPRRRSRTYALAEWHTDAIRPDAFLRNGPLDRFDLIARSTFCAPDVPTIEVRDDVFRDPSGENWCATIPEAFRSRDRGWPVIGTQFHAEQRDFANAAPGDPPESIADARLFLAAVYEDMVDAYEQFGP